MGCTLHEEKADAVVSEDTLEHWESLLVVTAGDAEAVALELSAEDVSCDLLSNTLVVEVTTVQGTQGSDAGPEVGTWLQDAVILNFDALLAARFWAGNVELWQRSSETRPWAGVKSEESYT